MTTTHPDRHGGRLAGRPGLRIGSGAGQPATAHPCPRVLLRRGTGNAPHLTPNLAPADLPLDAATIAVPDGPAPAA